MTCQLGLHAVCLVHHCGAPQDPPEHLSLLTSLLSHPLQVPAWPFVVGSFAFGIFALAPYFALWEPPEEKPQVPPAKADLVRLLQACTTLIPITSCCTPGIYTARPNPCWHAELSTGHPLLACC